MRKCRVEKNYGFRGIDDVEKIVDSCRMIVGQPGLGLSEDHAVGRMAGIRHYGLALRFIRFFTTFASIGDRFVVLERA